MMPDGECLKDSDFLLVRISRTGAEASTRRGLNETKVVLDGVTYTNSLGLRFLGFYDFLRNADGITFGVRVWIREIEARMRALLDQKQMGGYLKDGVLVIEFVLGQKEIIDHSCDQAFDFSAVYENDSGDLLYCFETNNVQDLKLQSIC